MNIHRFDCSLGDSSRGPFDRAPQDDKGGLQDDKGAGVSGGGGEWVGNFPSQCGRVRGCRCLQ